ncbi:DNA/RNA polymerase [Leucogyrophana mollusca]|uniref:DNA/RNA polymerase n=1 Tax=Leucogyrophana mollusca TaxID=85980 RepID=A0ACB8BPW3_9AGAM|nr:DNA/RNA polymerase [Leucogyrophana mollusca]
MASGSPTKPNILWKGKAKAIQEDYDDLRPTITYRHILSHNLGVKDPLRVVALCDSDAFYAACERVRLGLDPNVPLVVQQWESIIAVGYSARKFGISRMDKAKEAKKKCPDLVAVHVATYKEGEKEPGYWDNVDTRTHKVSLDLYRRESNKILNMFKEALPTGEIEKASIDEAFIDFTRPVREKLLERYAYLAQVPPDAPEGIDSPLPPPPPINWDGLGHLVPMSLTSEDTGEYHERDDLTTWHDVALSIGAEFMDRIRKDVAAKLGYTTSAGIARNKFLAKLSASYKKPDSQTILRNNAIPSYLRPMAFQKIRFLGGKLGDAIAKEYDVSTVGDLLSINLDEMQRKFGEHALWVYELIRGIDRTEVKEKSALFKSMLASKNLPKPITKPSEGHHWIRVLAAELALRLNDAREIDPTLWPRTIVLHARKGYETSRSKQATFPFVRDVTVDIIAGAADKLWKEITGNAQTVKVTSVQLAFTGLEAAELGQQSIEGFFKSRDMSRKRPRDEDPPLVGTSEVNKSRRHSTPTPLSSTSMIADDTSFVCRKCGERIELRDTQIEGGDRAEALAALRLEHNDFHFAQDLASASEPPVSITSPAPRAAKRKKNAVEPKGIAKFFRKQ